MVLARFSMVLPTVPMVLGWFSSMALARSPMDLLRFSKGITKVSYGFQVGFLLFYLGFLPMVSPKMFCCFS